MEPTTTPPAVIHVDLDGASAIYTMHGWPYPYDIDPLFETGVKNLLVLLDDLNVKATLFVIAADLDDPRKRALLETAVIKGHEIASHAYTHRKITTLPRDVQVREVSASRQKIASTLGVPVNGFRAPYFDVNGEVLELVAEAGYRYDSSVFPGTRLALAGEAFTATPMPRSLPLGGLAEIPLPAYRPLPFPFHASYSLVFGTWYFGLGLTRFRRTGAPLVSLFHLTDFADPLPAEMLRGLQTRLFTLSYLSGASKRRRCARMLGSVRRNYRLVDTPTLLAESVNPGEREIS
jgi:peptidoglycan/xylan/chitin deacetylase (PgdA/CDA1 family)